LLHRFLALISRISIQRKELLIHEYYGTKNHRLSILDVGCGSGNFLLGINSTRFNKYGTEINKEAYDICRRKGLRVVLGSIEKIDFKRKFDVVSLWQVLEHVANPIGLFNKISKVLSSDGLLIFQVPNTDSLGFLYGKDKWFHLDSPRHLFLYNKKSVMALCQQAGFETVAIINEYYDYPLDLFWSIRNSPLKFLIYPLYPFFKLISRESLTFVCKKKSLRATVS